MGNESEKAEGGARDSWKGAFDLAGGFMTSMLSMAATGWGKGLQALGEGLEKLGEQAKGRDR